MSETIEEMRCRMIKIALKRHSCYIIAASKLEITYKTLYNYRKKLGKNWIQLVKKGSLR